MSGCGHIGGQPRAPLRRQGGFTLVELMVAMTLSLLLLAGALSILNSARVTNIANERIARLQEAGRTVTELMLRDARPAGFLGCSRPITGDEFVNGLNNSNTLLWDFGAAAFGHDAGATMAGDLAALTPSATAGSDILVLRTTRQGQPVFRLNAPVIDTTADIQVDRPTGVTVPPGTPMIISDCEGSSVFVATSFTPDTATTALIGHAAGAGSPSNAADDLTRGFVIGAQVMPVQTIIYYVRDSASGSGPALWQRVGNDAPQELIQGIENLQLLYGVDTDGDLLANEYLRADEVDAANRWRDVIAVSLALLVRSTEATSPDVDTREYTLFEETVGPFNDQRQRTVYTTTVVLRNRTF